MEFAAFQRRPMLSVVEHLNALPRDSLFLVVDESLLENPDMATVTSPEDHRVAKKGAGRGLASTVAYLLDRTTPAFVVGRKVSCEVCIRDARISSRHAEFRTAPEGTYWLSDLSSSNGTFVNGRDISKAKSLISAGTTFHLGVLPVLLADGARLRQIAAAAMTVR